MKNTLYKNVREFHILEVFISTGKNSSSFYKKILDFVNFYKLQEDLIIGENVEYDNVRKNDIFEFKPNEKMSFYKKEGDMYTSSAYNIDSFNEPEHLGTFYSLTKEELDKNIKSLFL